MCYAITCTADRGQDDEITRQEDKSFHEGRKLWIEQFKLINTEAKTFEVDDADVDSANLEILTVEEDEDGDEDDNIEIDN